MLGLRDRGAYEVNVGCPGFTRLEHGFADLGRERVERLVRLRGERGAGGAGRGAHLPGRASLAGGGDHVGTVVLNEASGMEEGSEGSEGSEGIEGIDLQLLVLESCLPA